MNDLEKAKIALANKAYSISEIARRSGVPLGTLRTYQQNPEKMGNAGWEKINAIARAYDEMNESTAPQIKLTPAQYLEKIESEGYVPLDTVFEEYQTSNVKHKGVFFLGRALERIGHADVAFFMPNWESARGCRLEHQVCEEYGVPIVELDPL